MEGKENRTYLGDGLYASFDGFQITLSTERYGDSLGELVEHFVCLDYYVLHSFQQYIEKVKALDRT